MRNLFLFRKKRFQIFTFSLIAGVFVVLSLMMFFFQMNKSMTDNFWISLEEVLTQQKSSIQYILKSQIDMLEIVANYTSERQILSKEEEIIAILQEFQKDSDFEALFFSSANGISLSSTGDKFYIAGEPFFAQALSDHCTISAPSKSPITKKDIAIVTVPVLDTNGKVIAIVGGTCSIEYINSLIMESFSGMGYAYIATPDNTLIAKTTNAILTQTEQDIAYKAIQNLVAKGKTTYEYNGIKRYLAYTRLGINDWTLMSIVPATALSDQMESIWQSAILATIINFIVFALLITMLVMLQAKHSTELARAAFLDTVTGGITLQKFMTEAEYFIAANKDKKLIAICLDINDFRIINDLYGFNEGNTVLMRVYDVLKEQIGATGILCRVSNDMFYVLRKIPSTEDAIVTEQNNFSDLFNTLIEKDGKHYRVSFTFGFYVVENHETSATVIFERANHVHNKAKKEGAKNVFYKENFRESAIKHKIIENSMRDAFDNHEFKMFLQPKYQLLTKKLVGAEALIRWESPKSGKQYPDDFIPVFEKTGFIIQTDLYMMERTCQILREWIDMGITPVPISVNQSKLLLMNPLYFNVITATIEEYRIPPEFIEIEITETIMYENTEVLNELISKLHEYGLRIAVDDFGSGYSSLVLLRDIKADVLKIDKAFIYKAESDAVGRKILASIIQLADTLNMSILAEGIETKAQADMLTHLGCHEAQGYLFGKPIPVESFIRQQMAV